MISPSNATKLAQKFVVDNAPSIMTGLGIVGACSTAYLTGKASFKAAELIKQESLRRYRMTPLVQDGEPAIDTSNISTPDKIKLVWTVYIPPAATLATTVSCIFFAHRVSASRMAALAAAYSLSERNLSEYKAKIVEKLNPNKEQQVRDEIAQDRVTKNPPQEGQILMVGSGEVLCYDKPSDRYFPGDVEKIRRIENDINQQVLQQGSATLTELYTLLGLNPTSFSNEVGWTIDMALTINFAGTLTEKNLPCVCIDYGYATIRGYHQGSNEEPPF